MKSTSQTRKEYASASVSPRFRVGLAIITIGSAAALGLMVARSHPPGIEKSAPVSKSAWTVQDKVPKAEGASPASTPSVSMSPRPGTVGESSSTSALIATIVHEPASEMAFQAAVGLANQGPEAMQTVLEALRKAQTAQEAGLLATALAMNGSGDSVEGLIQVVLSETDASKRTAMLEALNNLTHPEGVTLLASAFSATDDSEVITAASGVIARAAVPDTVDYLAEIYAESPRFPSQQDNVLAALRGIQNPSTLPSLTATAQRADAPELSAAAATSMAKLGTPEAVLALRDAYNAVHAQSPESDLALRLLETFEGMSVDAQNLPLIATIAENGPSHVWAEAARRMLIRAGDLNLKSATPSGTVTPHYTMVDKSMAWK